MPNHERELQDETRSQTECEACSIKSFLNNGITNDEKKKLWCFVSIYVASFGLWRPLVEW